MKDVEKKNNDLTTRVELSVRYLQENTTFAYILLDENDNEILPARVPITKEIINNFKKSNIENVYYYKKDISQQKKSSLQAYLDKNSYQGPRTIKVDTQKKAINVMQKLTKAIKNIILDMNSDDIKDLVSAINEDLNNSAEDIVNLLDSIENDDYIYAHSLNVGVISMYFANKLRLSEEVINEIGIGAFIHDIGKSKIPENILYKSDDLTPQERTYIQEHSYLGYELVQEDEKLPELAKKIVLFHHERYDGSGYPYGMSGDEIDKEIEIVSLADFFDDITSPKSYKETLSVPKALELISKNANQFRNDMIQRFLKEMHVMFRESTYYVEGTYVLLNTNELAKVEAINKQDLLRPKVLIISNMDGKRLKHPIEVNLSIDYSRDIVKKM